MEVFEILEVFLSIMSHNFVTEVSTRLLDISFGDIGIFLFLVATKLRVSCSTIKNIQQNFYCESEKYGVSDNAIRKWERAYKNIEYGPV